jgi:hypothetical protein
MTSGTKLRSELGRWTKEGERDRPHLSGAVGGKLRLVSSEASPMASLGSNAEETVASRLRCTYAEREEEEEDKLLPWRRQNFCRDGPDCQVSNFCRVLSRLSKFRSVEIDSTV